MKLTLKSMLKDRNVLYVVLFLAVSNLFGYMLMREMDAVIFFLVVGFLTTYFSKNMIVIMVVAMISTNLLLGSKKLRSVVTEGYIGSEARPKTKKVSKDEVDITVDKKPSGEIDIEVDIKEPMAKLSPAPVNGKKPKLDYAGTMESAYDNLDSLLSSDALKNMGSDTQRLAEKQKLLMNNITKLEPIMQKASKLLDSLDMGGINGMIEKLGGTLGGLSGK